MKLELGEWLPDLPALDNPGCINAQNVIPTPNAYAQLRDLKSFSGALTGACLGAAWIPDLAGNAFNFAGDSQRLYKYNSTNSTWTDISRTATYSVATSWSFEKFGAYTVATSISNAPQYFDMSSGGSTTFQNLAGSPPSAKYVAAVRDFLVLANISGHPNRVQWSGFNNSALWTPSLATQSDYQDLLGAGGDVQGIVPGEYGVIFQENSIWRMSYVGPPTVFRFDEVERGHGTAAPKSIVWYGGSVWYYDWSGFHFFNGQQSIPIGHDKIDSWFERNCSDPTSLQGAVDRQNRLIFWAFKSSSAQPSPNRLLVYHFGLNKWSWANITTEWLSERRAPTPTLDQLDAILASGIDIDSIDVDSKAFGGQLNLQIFNAAHKACTFEGDPLIAIVETKELAFDEARSEITSIMPLVDGDSPTVTVQFASRNTQARTSTYSVATGLNRIGEACRVVNARYQRIRLTITGGFDFVKGIDVRGRKAGRR